MSTDDHELRRLQRLKWSILGLTALTLVALEAFYYFVRGVPLLDDLVEWLIGMAIAGGLIEITFRAVARPQRHLQHEIAERRQAEEELRRHTARLETLRGVGLELDAQAGPDDLLRSVVGRAIQLIGGTTGSIYLHQMDRDVLERAIAVGPSPVPLGDVIRRGAGLPGQVWEKGQPLVVDDCRRWEGRAAECEDCAWSAAVGVPLHWRSEFLGTLQILADAPNAFSPADAELLNLFATHAAGAIHRARLFAAERMAREQAETRERHLSLLNDITRAALDTPDLPTMLQTLANRLGALIEADGCYLTLWDEARQRTIPGAAYGPMREDYPKVLIQPDEATMTATVLRTGQPLVVEDVFNTPYLSPRIAALFPARSQLALPLVAGNEKLGAMLIAFNQPHQFSPDEIARCEQAAGQIALAVAKARLFGQAQHEIAERKQAEETREQLVRDLREALAQVKTLHGLLPICANCKKIRDDQGYWHSVEVYVRDHSEAEFSHGICPECMKVLYPWFRPTGK